MRTTKRQRKHLKKLEQDVFQNEDYKRHIIETAKKLELPVEIVDTVMNNFLTNIVLSIYLQGDKYKRILVFNFIKFFIKPLKKNNT